MCRNKILLHSKMCQLDLTYVILLDFLFGVNI
jgi:hypothetical protein